VRRAAARPRALIQRKGTGDMAVNVNTHIHTPWSFSGFDSVRQAVELAKQQGMVALGISDFNTVDGYDEFDAECRAAGVFPLYNIEFIALLPEDKRAGIRWNDPANPGIMYFCGKALSYPVSLSPDSRHRLSSLWKGTQDQIQQMIDRLNDHLARSVVPLSFDYADIRKRYARKTVRERHLARALYDAIREKTPDDAGSLELLRAIFADPAFTGNTGDSVAMQNEIRNRLLKAGKPAYVEEGPSAFLSLDEVKGIILDGGGIPCYPVLSDDSRPLNEREADVAALADSLQKLCVHAVEFIPSRNSLEHLRRYVLHFRDRGFTVTFGTEHNTPDCPPLTPCARGGVPFDPELERIAWEGACVLAAHQQLVREGKSGFVDGRGVRLVEKHDMKSFVAYGARVMGKT